MIIILLCIFYSTTTYAQLAYNEIYRLNSDNKIDVIAVTTIDECVCVIYNAKSLVHMHDYINKKNVTKGNPGIYSGVATYDTNGETQLVVIGNEKNSAIIKGATQDNIYGTIVGSELVIDDNTYPVNCTNNCVFYLPGSSLVSGTISTEEIRYFPLQGSLFGIIAYENLVYILSGTQTLKKQLNLTVYSIEDATIQVELSVLDDCKEIQVHDMLISSKTLHIYATYRDNKNNNDEITYILPIQADSEKHTTNMIDQKRLEIHDTNVIQHKKDVYFVREERYTIFDFESWFLTLEKLSLPGCYEEPVKPGEEPVKPCEEPVKPGEEPVKPGKEPVKPGEEPVKPGEEPVEPGEEPVKPGEEPVEPGEEPVEPGKEPVEPGEEPVEPGKEPVEPGEEPGKPGEEPGKPGEEPGKPGEEPGKPGEEPGKPGEEPGKPGEEPVEPGEEPVKPGEEPVEPGEEPVKPGEEPVKPGEEPGKPGEEPVKTDEHDTKSEETHTNITISIPPTDTEHLKFRSNEGAFSVINTWVTLCLLFIVAGGLGFMLWRYQQTNGFSCSFCGNFLNDFVVGKDSSKSRGRLVSNQNTSDFPVQNARDFYA